MAVVTSLSKLTDSKLLERAAVLYPIAKRMLELAEAGDEQAVVGLNRTLFGPGYERLFPHAEIIPRNGGQPQELPRELDLMRNGALNAFTYTGYPEEDKQTRQDFLIRTREAGERIENILETHEPPYRKRDIFVQA